MTLKDSQDLKSVHDEPAKGMPVTGWVILVLTALLACIWSFHKLLDQDEIFSLQTDRVASLSEVLRIQREYPISLEPPPYHVLSHAAMTVLGPTAFALRLPSFVGYLVMQFCLFFIVRNLAGRRAGLIAMAIPGLTATLYYAAEGRPYGLLLGSYAAAALFWQIASRMTNGRLWPLMGLAGAIALTLNVHFYGVLLLIAIGSAELVRTVVKRRVDWPMLTAIGAGMASLAATIPYIKASSEFKKHYYVSAISTHMLTQPYRQMLIDYTTYPKMLQTAIVFLILLLGVGVALGLRKASRERLTTATAGDWAMIWALVLMPVFAFGLGRGVTHALEVRHSIGAILGISTLMAIAVSPWLRDAVRFKMVMAVLLVGMVAADGARILHSAAEDRQLLSGMQLSNDEAAAVASRADKNIYFQDMGQWEMASLYTPDPELRSRLVLIYSEREEMGRQQHDTNYLTAIHTRRFSTQPIVEYDRLRQVPGEHIFVLFHTGWSWTDAALAEEADRKMPLGKAFGGDLTSVTFGGN